MINLLAVLLTTLLFIFVGSPYAWLLGKQTKVEHYSLAYLLGSGLTTWLWFIAYNLGFPLTLISLAGSSLLGYLIGYLLCKITSLSKIYLQTKPNGSLPWIAIILCLLFIVLVVDLYQPVTAWDALTLYDFRAKVIAVSHNLSTLELDAYYLDYPLMTSLTHTIVYLFKGNNPQALYAITFMSLVGLVYGRLKTWTNDKLALIGSLLVASSPQLWGMSVIAYTNLPYAALLLSGLLYGVNGSLILSGLLLGLSTWVRSTETFWLIGVFLLFWQGIRLKKIFSAVLGITFTLIVRQSWLLYRSNAFHRLDLDISSAAGSFLPGRVVGNLPSVLHYLSEHVLIPYLPIWLTFVIVIPLILRLKNARLLQLWFILLFSLAMTAAGTLVLSTYFESWYSIGGSVERMLIFLVPLGAILLVGSYNILGKVKYDKK